MEQKMDVGINRRIKLNVGGTIFITNSSTLMKFSGSKLANIETYGEHYSADNNEYYFDRNPVIFAHILDAYRKGAVHVPRDVCGTTFKQELEFWDISPAEVATCCWQALYQSEEDEITVADLIRYYLHNTNSSLYLKERKSLRERIWLFFDEPTSSVASMIWGVSMTIIVLLVVLLESLMTLPELNEKFVHEEEAIVMRKLCDIMGYDNDTYEILLAMKPNPAVEYTSLLCHVILTLEFIVTFLACPCKKEFVKSSVRILVFIGYASFWASHIMIQNMQFLSGLHMGVIYLILKHLATLEVFRLFYIAKNVPAFHVIGVTFSSSRQELTIFISILGILIIIFGKFILYVEMFHDGNIQNAFKAMYWALITLTTVGYGDYTPSTTFGHVIACACALCGLLVLSMPIGVIASSFYTFFSFRKYAQKHFERYGRDSKRLLDICTSTLTKDS